MPQFFEAMDRFLPHLIVVGGLQMMDNFPYKNHDEMRQRLMSLHRHLASKSMADVLVHFEMASFTDEMLIKNLIELLLPVCDSLGLNEQELANLHSFLTKGTVALAEDAYVNINTELDKIRFIFSHAS